MVRRSAFPRLLLLEAVLCAVAALLASALASASEEPDGVETPETGAIALQPGDNFVGCVAEPLAVADLFEQILEVALIYRWHAGSRAWQYTIREVGGNLESLDPGMAAKIRISGDRTVKWERALSPAKGAVTLYSGTNWVAWNGRDEWPLDQVARGIGTSLVNIEVRGQVYQPGSEVSNDIGPLTGEASIRRGDGLRVTVNRDLRWLQPTGMMPRIVRVGDVPQSLQDEITADVRRVVDFFAEEFAVETDFSDTTVLVWKGVNAAVEYLKSGAEPNWRDTPETLRVRLTNHSLAQATQWGFTLPACGWQPPCPLVYASEPILTVAHEWFHHLQNQLSGRREADWGTLVQPAWMAEGVAIWSEWQLPKELSNLRVETERNWRIEAAARTTVTLPSTEEGNQPWHYRLGALAAERLGDTGDVDAHIEFNRQLFPQVVGGERLWVRAATWQEAFEAAFEITAARFYKEFADWRATLPAPARRFDYGPNDVELSGTLRNHDGSPAAGFRLRAAPYIGEGRADLERETMVDDEGALLPRCRAADDAAHRIHTRRLQALALREWSDCNLP